MEPTSNTSTNTNPRGYWFKRRRYGWGWTPASPQGWLALAVFVGALMLPKVIMGEDSQKGIPGKIWRWGLSAGFLAFVSTRGPKPRWRWGGRSDDNPVEDA